MVFRHGGWVTATHPGKQERTIVEAIVIAVAENEDTLELVFGLMAALGLILIGIGLKGRK